MSRRITEMLRLQLLLLLLAVLGAGHIARAETPPAVAEALLDLKAAPPLPAPKGDIVRVRNTAELEQAVKAIKSGQTVLLAAGE